MSSRFFYAVNSCLAYERHAPLAPSDEGAVSEADWGRDYPSVTCGDSSPDKGSQGPVRIRKLNENLQFVDLHQFRRAFQQEGLHLAILAGHGDCQHTALILHIQKAAGQLPLGP